MEHRSFVRWRALGMFPLWGCDHSCSGFCADVPFFLLHMYLGAQLLDPLVTLPNWFSRWLHHFTPVMYKGSSLSTPTSTLAVAHFFYYHHLSAYEVISHCGFALHFPNDSRVSTLSSCVIWSFVSARWRNVYASPLPIFFSWFVFLLLELEEFFVCSR